MELIQHPETSMFKRPIVKLSDGEIATLEAAADICERASKMAKEDPFDGVFADGKFYLRQVLAIFNS